MSSIDYSSVTSSPLVSHSVVRDSRAFIDDVCNEFLPLFKCINPFSCEEISQMFPYMTNTWLSNLPTLFVFVVETDAMPLIHNIRKSSLVVSVCIASNQKKG